LTGGSTDCTLTGMKRLAAVGLSVLLVWGLAPGVGEFLENALHFVQEGHLAHATPDGDHHDPTGPEHGCTGAAHLCSCCVSLSFMPTHTAATIDPEQGSGELMALDSTRLPALSIGGIYHPPRA